MSLIDRYEQQATDLRRPTMRREHIITDWDAMRDINVLMGEEQRYWRPAMRELHESGVPVGLPGGIAGVEASPPPLALPAVTLNATEAAPWPSTPWTPIAANRQAPTAYRLSAWGNYTAAASAGTFTINPRVGTSSAGITMGISGTITPTNSATATIWRLFGEMIVRVGGGPSTASAHGWFKLEGKFATAGNGATDVNHLFGFTAASFDSTAAQGLFMGIVAATSTTNTITPQGIVWASWN